MEETPKRPANEQLTQFGSATAVSNSADNLRPGEAPSRSDQTMVPPSRPDQTMVPPSYSDQTTVPASRSDQTMIPPTRSDETIIMGAEGTRQTRATTRAEWSGGWGETNPELEPGTVLANRYEILSVLGTGGMGSVYKAQDRELDRLVALKVIRPELARNSAIVDRFKQEIRLSHKVTHRNVVRMYDLSEDAGMRFVTMELVAGRDLRSILEERGKLPPDEAVDIFQQICLALQTAHGVGILHRDLKPQNVMREDAGRVVVMDFGLARTIVDDNKGMTQTGALVGTVDYMSPEQALGKDLDQRSDIFALGLIGYEMLTGAMPFRAESAIASLLKRTREPAEQLTKVDPTIPGALSGIIGRCLENDLAVRYKTVEEVLRDLEAWREKAEPKGPRRRTSTSAGKVNRRTLLISAGVAAVVLAASVPLAVRYFKGSSGTAQTAAAPSLSLAIMPFYNASGDQSEAWLGTSLQEMLSTDIGGSAQVRMVSPDRLQQVLHDLHISPDTQTDVASLRRVADFTNAQTLIFGQYIKLGSQIRITTTILDVAHDTRSALTTDVADEKNLLSAVDQLAGQLRQKLTTDTKVLKDLQAHAARPSTTSIDALRAYEAGLALERSGDNLKALDQFQAATTADSNFALAFSQLAVTYGNLGHDDLAQNASRTAMELSANLPPQERYLIEAENARINNNTQKAIDAYQQLAAANPNDTDVQFALATMYEQESNFDDAKKRLAAVLANDPKNVAALLASGRVAIKGDDPNGGLEFLSRALPLATELDNQEEKASILQAMGIAYSSLHRPDDALRNYQESLSIKEQIGDKRGEAASLEQIADIQDQQGKPTDALATYQKALALRREISDQSGIGNSLIDIGMFYHDHAKPDDALKNYNEALQIERQLGDQDHEALCLHDIGTIKMDQGAYQDSLTYLEQAYELRKKLNVPGDIADSLHNLAEVNTKMGQFDTALSDYLKAIDLYRGVNDQRGVAVESNGMAKIFAAQGRYGAGLSAMKDALNIVQQSKETTSLTVEVVGGWGDLLAEVGRGDEGNQSLDRALQVAQQIHNDWAVALVTNWIGNYYYYKGDFSTARQQYDHALASASKTADKETILLSKVNRAKADLGVGHTAAVIPEFKKLAQDADQLGLKALSVECSVYLAEAEVAAKNTAAAQQALGLTLARAQNLGLRVLEAKAQGLQGTLAANSGKNSEAKLHYRQVMTILDAIRKEDNSSKLLDRADLKDLYADAQKAEAGH